jgi:isopentenyl-diphosphate delta-isomerase
MASTNLYDHISFKNSVLDETFVILVDENDNAIGIMEKIEAHHQALLHRAVSVFIFNSNGDWILQRRAFSKYHSSGLWSNSCCSHPNPGESSIDAARRRLIEEMGIKSQLNEIFSFTYKAVLENDLTEYELDHIFVGISDASPQINPAEVAEWKAISFSDLQSDMIRNPDNYTVWFKKLYEWVGDYMSEHQLNPLLLSRVEDNCIKGTGKE